MRTTLKVAELATFIYAILVFGSMCIEMSYFSSFDISIAAYLQISEILFMFLGKPVMYVPLILMIISMLIFPGYRYNYSNDDNIKNRYKEFTLFSFTIILCSSVTIFVAAYVYDVLYTVSIIFCSILAFVSCILPTPVNDILRGGYIALVKMFTTNLRTIKERTNKIYNKPVKQEKSVVTRLKRDINLNHYKKSKERYALMQTLCSNSFLYGVLVSYFIVVVGLSIVNLARAGSYIDDELSPKTIAKFATSDDEYICDNEEYLLISESANYIFIFDRYQKRSIAIPRDKVLKASYFLNNRIVMSQKTTESIVESHDVHGN